MLKIGYVILLILPLVSVHQQNITSTRINIYTKEQGQIIAAQVAQQILNLESNIELKKQWVRVYSNQFVQASIVEILESDKFSMRLQLEFYDSQEAIQQGLIRMRSGGKPLSNLGDNAYGEFSGKIYLRKGNVFASVEVIPKKEAESNLTKTISQDEPDEPNQTQNDEPGQPPQTHYEFFPLPSPTKQIQPRKEPVEEPGFTLAKKIAESVVKVLDEYAK